MNIFRRCLPLQSLLHSRDCGNRISGIPTYLRRNVRGNRAGSSIYDSDFGTEHPEAGNEPVSEASSQEVSGGTTGRRRRNVKKILVNSATFQEISPQVPQMGDPFISGPYTQGTKIPKDVRADMRADSEDEVVKINPKTRTIIQFPGDGTQYLKMCGNPALFPSHIKILYDIASGILNYDLVDLIMNGPVQKLDQPRYSQVAVLVSSLAALELLRDFDPKAVENCAATAGFGIGEAAALVLAGSLTFEDAVGYAKYRGEALQLAGEITKSGLAVVFYGADSKLGDAMTYAEEWCRKEHNIVDPVCSTAHYLFPHCKVIGGNKQALDFIEMNYKEFKLRKVKRLPASAAYHTLLMKPAAEPVKAYVNNIIVSDPRIHVYSSMSGFPAHTPKMIKANLVKQLYCGLRWEQALHAMYSRPVGADFPFSYECGPGKSLGLVLKMVNRKAYTSFRTIPPSFKLEEAAASASSMAS